jgi:hypothetical protein
MMSLVKRKAFTPLAFVTLAICYAPSLAAVKRPIPEVVADLRDHYCSPISLIMCGGKSGLVDDSVLGETVDSALKSIANQSGCYEFEAIDQRFVLYPTGSEYGHTLKGVEIKQLPRIEATDAYVGLLRTNGYFPGLVSAPIVGDDRSPVFRDKVSLRTTGRVVDQLIDLLGNDGRLYLEVLIAPSGHPYINFDRVKCK